VKVRDNILSAYHVTYRTRAERQANQNAGSGAKTVDQKRPSVMSKLFGSFDSAPAVPEPAKELAPKILAPTMPHNAATTSEPAPVAVGSAASHAPFSPSAHTSFDESLEFYASQPEAWEMQANLKSSDESAEAEAKVKAESVGKVRAENEAKVKAESEAKVRAENEAKVKAENEAKVRAQNEAKVRAENEAKVRAEYEAKMRAEKEAQNAVVTEAVTIAQVPATISDTFSAASAFASAGTDSEFAPSSEFEGNHHADVGFKVTADDALFAPSGASDSFGFEAFDNAQSSSSSSTDFTASSSAFDAAFGSGNGSSDVFSAFGSASHSSENGTGPEGGTSISSSAFDDFNPTSSGANADPSAAFSAAEDDSSAAFSGFAPSSPISSQSPALSPPVSPNPKSSAGPGSGSKDAAKARLQARLAANKKTSP
jgi:hypothetical protein